MSQGPEPAHTLIVTERRAEAEGVVSLTLRRADGSALPPWQPGAHVDLVLGNGLERQYSLCGDPSDAGSWRIAVLLEPDGRGGSEYVHRQLPVGTRVGARGPRNHFELLPAERYWFIAGGIGITPVLPMVAAAEAAGARWSLLYGGRSRSSMAFVDELARYDDRVVLRPQDRHGLLDLAAHLGAPTPGTRIYCCGPGGLLDAVEAYCQDAGWPEPHVERFEPKADGGVGGGGGVVVGGGGDRRFEIELSRTGRTLDVPADASILDAVRAAGVPVLYSCTEGTCGTCETDVLDGVPDHRDSVLTAAQRAAGDTMMICVSRARTDRLVLDL
ncbi:PDR/VanB family oxidoreductase [Catenulispora pinisilvae]|uniref:PDR/VanB family oxidoreductase n=1 Tax=Catenulispora pinisilvae TaxID=2705253 RepID=UPI002B278D30|nr:PDR/VanB family oxidoreductase [Catenulispora pinisilvae]